MRFYFEFLCRQYNAKRLLLALETLKCSPNSTEALDLCYQRVIKRIKEQEDTADLALSVLSWLAKAKRPLEIEELQEALAVEDGVYELDRLNLTDAATLVEICAGLVEIDECSGTVVLTHYTIQEYLLDPGKSILPDNTDFKITMACITYLSFDTFAQGPCRSEGSLQRRLKSHPFLAYAAHHLSDHFREYEWPQNSPTAMLLGFLAKRNTIASYLQVLQSANGGISFFTKDCLRLHVASLIGYVPVVSLLLEEGVHASRLDGNGKTPLHIAAFAGHGEVAQLLLGKGADISPTDENGETPLHIAAYRGYLELVRLLLDNGAKISAVDEYGWTPLHLAASTGHGEVVQLLLDNGENLSNACQNGRTLLQSAVESGNRNLVQFLLENGADPSHSDQDGWVPLHSAAQDGYREIAQLLLDKGANPSPTDDDGETPLRLAAYSGYPEVVQLLLDQGANLSHVDKDGRTPLYSAAEGGHAEVVQLLLENGANLSDTTADGGTPFRAALEGGHLEVVQLLVDWGVNPLL